MVEVGDTVRVRLLPGHLAGDWLPHDVAEGQEGRLVRMVDEHQALVQFLKGPRFIYRAFLNPNRKRGRWT
ncbi:MAG: hypothetical protein Q8O40_11820 [Chloroflexota bacterium]|nr:hypothetical protein [Chloroflexota bacterium]